MAVAQGNCSQGSSEQPCDCYVVSSLGETILETNQTSTLKDRYILGAQLGWGQFGVIRVCTDKSTGEVLACKSIAKDRLVTSDDARSVKLEIEIMSRLSGHPNVVDLKAVYEDEDYVHLVMELCAGGELFHKLEKHGRFPEAQARGLFRHLMQVISYCHEKGIVHRDLKPENILFATTASASPIKLADFGLATYIKPGQNLSGTVGSPFYIAPEVLMGGYNQAADVWSTGVILYILLSGMPPFWGETKSRIFDAVRAADLRFPSDPWDRISESAKALVRGMLCTDPSRRLTARQVLGEVPSVPEVEEERQTPKVVAPTPEQLIEIKDDEPSQHEKLGCGEWNLGTGSLSTLMARKLDISFGAAPHSTSDIQSPTFTCSSSFSSFLVEPSTPTFLSSGFSYCSNSDSNALELSSPISSMPSFAFFSPGPVIEKGCCAFDFSSNIYVVNATHGDSFLGCGREAREMEQEPLEAKRAGGTIGSRMFRMHNKRNHTIGLGEREELDFTVTESVIRWASCTHLPTGPSLVC